MAEVPSPADMLSRVLVDLKFGTNPAEEGKWPIYVNREPNKPDDCITVFDTVGVIEPRLQFEKRRTEKFGIQIRIRAREPKQAKANEIRDGLDLDVKDNTIQYDGLSYTVHSVSRITGVVPLGIDPASGCDLFTINAQLTLSNQ